MTPHTLFIILLIIVIAGFLFDQWINYLNTTTRSTVLPQALKGFYDEDTYRRQQEYEAANYSFRLVSDIISSLVIILALFLGGFAWLDSLVRVYTDSAIFQALLFFGLLAFASDLLSTPFDLYHTFVIEERFGFNKTSPLTFILDKLKGWLLAAFIGGGILALIVYIYEKSGARVNELLSKEIIS